MGNIFSFHFWFNLRPGQLMPAYQNILVIIVIVLAIISALAFALKRNKKDIRFRFWEKVFSFTSTNAFIGLLLWFFSHEGIPFFSSRFWYLVWIAGIIVWKIFIFKYYKTLPEKKKQIEEEKAYKKYIP